jgi:cation diffusion facilitator CzcD-associated flavoprotein CzcO
VLAVPGEDPIHNLLSRLLPDRATYALVRWKNVALQAAVYRASRRWPNRMRRFIRRLNARRLPEDYEVDVHFKPTYNPWDQRMCIVPKGDLFDAICEGNASVVTDEIDTFTENGIRLASGQEIAADIVVTATGLNMQPFGNIGLTVDGEPVELPKTMAYKGMMLSGVPNFAFAIGYTNASWTLKADLTAEHVCRLLNHMDKEGQRIATPVNDDPSVTEEPILDFSSGYVLRALHLFPKNGSKAPWKLRQNYPRDVLTLRFGPVAGEGLRFSNPPPAPGESVAPETASAAA